MKWIAPLIIVLFLPLTALAQGTPPDRISICATPDDCIQVVKTKDGFMGLVDGGARPAWKFAIEKWGLSRVTMVGTAVDADSKGKYETVTINGVPEMLGTGVMHTKARYKGGKHSTCKVTVTWKLPPFKMTGRGFH